MPRKKKGINMPYSCRAGACDVCKCQLNGGGVDQSDQSFLDDEEIDQGFILPCVSYPRMDCSIRLVEGVVSVQQGSGQSCVNKVVEGAGLAAIAFAAGTIATGPQGIVVGTAIGAGVGAGITFIQSDECEDIRYD